MQITEIKIKVSELCQGYTDCVSYLQAQDLLGDGWTIDVISHIFSFIPQE